MEVRDNFFYSLYMMWLEVGMYYVELILIFGCGISQQRMESNTGCKYIITVECKEYRYCFLFFVEMLFCYKVKEILSESQILFLF